VPAKWKARGQLLNSTRPDGEQPASEVGRVHSGGTANVKKIAVVVKEEFFSFTAVAQRPSNPFFQSSGDHRAPQLFFGRPVLNVAKYSALKHGVAPWIFRS